VIQGFEALFLVLQIFFGPDEILHGFHVEKLVDVVVLPQMREPVAVGVPQEIRWDFYQLLAFLGVHVD
jgi:hypothetical protein